MHVYLDHGIKDQQCTCTQIQHFQGLNQRQTVERLVDALRDADALLKISHSVFGTIRDNLEGKIDPKTISKIVELTYSAQRIIDGSEEKITRAWLGD